LSELSISVKKLKLDKINSPYALSKDVKAIQSGWAEKLANVVDKLGTLIKK